MTHMYGSKEKRPSKKLAAIAALILVVTLLLGGAYAWRDYTQHKTNELGGDAYKHEIRLVEDFEEVDDWQQDQEIDKRIRVTNVGRSEMGYQDVYARIQLKEYMEIGSLVYEQTAERYMVDPDTGHFLTYDAFEKAQGDWGEREYKLLEDKVTGDSGWMVPTDTKDPDGQYGKHVVTGVTEIGGASVIPNVVRASDDAKKAPDGKHDVPANEIRSGHPRNGECDYTIHPWITPNAIADYIEWNLGDAYEFLSDWTTYGGSTDPHNGPFWLIDDLGEEGWIYWMQPIPPDGGVTADFLKSVTLIQQPEGPFYYAIHTELEGLSKDELGGSGWNGEVVRALTGIAVDDRLAGSGTEIDPYIIRTAEQMAWLAEVVNADADDTISGVGKFADKFWKLGNDIDLSAYGEDWNDGKGWVPIGTRADPFRGVFDGNENKITGLYINDDRLSGVGLFGSVSDNPSGEIKNLGLANTVIRGQDRVGGLVGELNGSVQICYVSGLIQGRISGYVGGVAGVINEGSITNCYFTGEVLNPFDVGGIVGVVNHGSVTNCYTTGVIEGSARTGGVVGRATLSSVIQDCAALNADINNSGSNDYGRVVGGIDTSITLNNNIAFSGMTVIFATFSGPFTGVDRDGADISIDAICTDGTLAGLFSGIPWTTQNGKLPGLFGQTVDIPIYITGHPFDNGNGTISDPYIITTAAQLAILAESVNNGLFSTNHYKLGRDIDLSAYGANWNGGRGWTPIGTQNRPFRGNFDGDGHQISGLYIGYEEVKDGDALSNQVGLFGSIHSGAVKNLTLSDMRVRGEAIVGSITGILASGQIIDCHITGRVGGSSEVGGMVGLVYTDERVGFTDSRIMNCSFDGSVTGEGDVGGIVGRLESGFVEGCYTLGTVNGFIHIGGIVGRNTPLEPGHAGYLNDCHSEATVSGGAAVGGVVGVNGAYVTGCYATGTVIGNSTNSGESILIGGVVGSNAGDVTGCYATGSVTGSNRVGGVIGGLSWAAELENCYATGPVSGLTEIGGVVGGTNWFAIIRNCYATGSVSGQSSVGGVVGFADMSANVVNCAGLNSSVAGATNVGRLAGENSNSILTNNIACNLMTSGGGTPFAGPFTGTARDGEDITAATIIADGTLGGRFSGAPWAIEDGKLPGLFGQTVDMPAHIQP